MRSPDTFQVAGVKRLGQQLLDSVTPYVAGQVGENNLGLVAGELPDHLPAAAAGRRDAVVIGHYCDFHDLALAFADGFEDGDPLGAHAQPVGRVLDVAAGEHTAV